MGISETSSAGKILRFGVFEVDLVSAELRKNGTHVHLQEQPFQVLAMLIERRGEMVSRDDLRRKLWPADTFVDFDHSLNTAVNKLREALGDAAANPLFVQTVARRGYRFIAPVLDNAASQNLEPVAPPKPSPVPQGHDNAVHPELEIPIPNRGLTRALFVLIQAMYLIFYVEALFHWQDVHRVAASFLPGWAAVAIVVGVVVTAGIGIPLRCFLISATGFDHRQLGRKFQHLFPAILAMDQLWAVAPFLLAGKIGFGPAFAATAALLYLPFSERSLVRMAYPGSTTVESL
jgi:cholera toxin transcriptional activator